MTYSSSVALAAAFLTLPLGVPRAAAKTLTLTFTSGVLAPMKGSPGVPGVTHFTFTFTAAVLPPKGGCTDQGTALVKFSDGAETNASLKAKGFVRQADSLELICTKSSGKLALANTTIVEEWVKTGGGTITYFATAGKGHAGIGLLYNKQPPVDYKSLAKTGKWSVKVAK